MDLDKLLGDEETTIAETKEEKPKEKKKKGKPRGGNSPCIGLNGYKLQEGDNTKFLQVNITLMNMENIDLHNVGEVSQRLNDYFTLYAENDMKPTVAGMAMALGMNRRTLWAIANDATTGGAGYKTALPREVADLIKKAYNIMENLWESYMNSGKMNPVTGIFLGKNNFGYQDKTEYVLTPNTDQDNDYDSQSIRDRYLPTSDYKQIGTTEE